MAQAKSRQLDLEKSMAELEQIVEELETGELSLDKSLKQFEKGVKISRDCQTALEAAEQKLQILMGDELQDVDPEGLDADE